MLSFHSGESHIVTSSEKVLFSMFLGSSFVMGP